MKVAAANGRLPSDGSHQVRTGHAVSFEKFFVERRPEFHVTVGTALRSTKNMVVRSVPFPCLGKHAKRRPCSSWSRHARDQERFSFSERHQSRALPMVFSWRGYQCAAINARLSMAWSSLVPKPAQIGSAPEPRSKSTPIGQTHCAHVRWSRYQTIGEEIPTGSE